ncbi:MAG TPA: DUF3224 domain-containing protein [Pseudonocardiaceae bacterium]|jgi:hypothetical protein|nr:DUF3224 domain-containing protein [Pseudonocardiaceae bacterium]
MTKQITSEYETLDWKETTYVERTVDRKITQVTAKGTFSGAVTGSGDVAYLLTYNGAHCDFIGYESVTGTVDGRNGSFVLQYLGSTAEGGLVATATVVPDSGTDELKGLRGTGGYKWNGGESQKAVLTLDYSID